LKASNFTEILRVEADMIHTDRRTDMTRVLCAFRSYAHAPSNRMISSGLRCVQNILTLDHSFQMFTEEDTHRH